MRSFVRAIPAFCAVTLLTIVSGGRASAQGDVVPKDLVILLEEVSDIESLRAMNPLNLTADQCGKIADEVKKVSVTHMKSVTAAAMPLQGMAAEVKALRKRLLTGGEVPEDFDRRGRKINEAFIAKRDAQKLKTLKTLSDAVRAILTETQIKKAIEASKKITRKDGKPTLQGTDDQFFNFWIQAVFVDYPGIVPLLEEMKKVRGSETAGEKAAEDGKPDPKVAQK